MSSSTAISAGGGGRVGWQVDLPGLASLVLNLGASGLKRFAEAGVDFHTILCMGEIAEKCAASNEYRRELSVCRQAQRTESQWLYKLVEIGAATNFVADELLKKRAGENVVALMSAILPVMSESSCDNLLLKLFEACKTPLDKTPGFAQLRSVRRSLTPLARKTQFKDRAFQYHALSRQLLDTDSSTANHTAYESIPSEETAVQVILALSKLVQEDSGLILAYHGLRGSGWVIAYARHILGLPVCVLRSTSKPVPISGDYQSARVLAYVFEQENKCELLSNCNVQDLFVTKNLDPSSHAGWSIDVGTTNVLDSYISAADPLRKGVSVLARSMADDYIQRPATRIVHAPRGDIGHNINIEGLIKYPVYCLPALRQRVTRILSLLGFDPVNGSAFNSSQWSEYIRLKKPKLEGSQRRKTVFTEPSAPPYLVAGPAWMKLNLGHTQVSNNGQRMEGWKDASAAYQDTRLTEQGIRHVVFLSRIVEAACLLSFTDWDQNLRLLSTSFLEKAAFRRESLELNKPLIEILTEKSSHKLEPRGMIELCENTIDMCIGGREVWTPVFSDERMLAFQHHGIIFAQHAGFYQTLSFQCCFVHLFPGAILTDGEERTKLYTYPTPQQKIESMTCLGYETYKQVAPVNGFPGISFSTRLEHSGESAYLRQEALVQDQIYAIPSPRIISGTLASLYVTEDCDHRYYDTITPTEIDRIVDKPHEDEVDKLPGHRAVEHAKDKHFAVVVSNGKRLKVKQGLFLAGAESDSSTLELWLQAVDQNGPGQWLAYQDLGTKDYFTVTQRDCCTACASKRVLYRYRDSMGDTLPVARYRDSMGDTLPVARIVHGRLAGEDME